MNDSAVTCADGADDRAACDAVCDPRRLDSLVAVGLTEASDVDMEHYAEWARTEIGTPLVVVSLVHPDRQVVPGASGGIGGAPPARSVPLSESVCRHVVSLAEPLVVPDTRYHPLTASHPAVDGGVIAYAGMPLTDESGHVLGALAAVDERPRAWTDGDLRTLRNIARACSLDLRLRLTRRNAVVESDRRDEIESGQRTAFDRSQMLLSASQAFTDTTSVDDVRIRIQELLGQALDPAHLTVVVTDERGRTRQFVPDGVTETGPQQEDRMTFAEAVLAPSAARGHGGVRYYPDRGEFDREHAASARMQLRELDLESVVSVPLPSGAGPLGSIVIGWTVPRAVEPTDLLTVATIAGYAGQALARARRLDHRSAVAREMQNAMLTTLPKVPGLPMAARYDPADTREYVGGDWFDATPITDPDHPEDQILALSVGDIVGHALPAVTIMGQVRSMLRQSTWDHPGGPPTVILEAFEAANAGLDLGAAGTAVVAHLRRTPDHVWSLTWVNAGHPPPVLVHPDGDVELLTEHDPLFGFDITEPGDRTDHHRPLDPGSVLFLYTDGLVEKVGSDLDDGTSALVELLGAVGDRSPREIVDIAVERLVDNPVDDVVAFAIRIPSPGERRVDSDRGRPPL